MHRADVLGLRVALGEEFLDRSREGVLVADALGRLQPPGGDGLQVVAGRRRKGVERGSAAMTSAHFFSFTRACTGAPSLRNSLL